MNIEGVGGIDVDRGHSNCLISFDKVGFAYLREGSCLRSLK